MNMVKLPLIIKFFLVIIGQSLQLMQFFLFLVIQTNLLIQFNIV